MIKADVGHLKHLYHLLKFIVDIKEAKLKLKPMKGNHWVMIGMCDASFASDLNNRRNVTGYMIFLCGVLVTWKSKLQKGVTKSTTESEYVALSELSGESLFLTRIVKFMW